MKREEEKDRVDLVIYKISNTKDDKVYIGCTTKSIEERKRDQKYWSEKGKEGKLYNAIATYGKECFNWEQIDNASSKEELAKKEKEYIVKYDSKESGFNADVGGGIKKIVYQFKLDGAFIESYNNLKDAASAVNVDKRNISKAALGKTKTCKGFRWSYSSTIELIELDSRKKKVNQYTFDYENVNSYASISEASEKTGVNRYSIAKVCRGERKSAGGYIWTYL